MNEGAQTAPPGAKRKEREGSGARRKEREGSGARRKEREGSGARRKEREGSGTCPTATAGTASHNPSASKLLS
jgi:hypothetical protein